MIKNTESASLRLIKINVQQKGEYKLGIQSIILQRKDPKQKVKMYSHTSVPAAYNDYIFPSPIPMHLSNF